MKRILVISDTHCGSQVGLTPPAWQTSTTHGLVWDKYVEIVKSLAPIHTIVVNGDTIDGQGYKSAGIDLITTDPYIQQEMAAQVIEVARAKNLVILAGTAAHTGVNGLSLDIDRGVLDIAKNLAKNRYKSAKYYLQCDLHVDNIIINFRHFTGARGNPTTRRSTGVLDQVWEEIRVAKGRKERCADILVRSHVHYHVYSGDTDNLVVITPALQLEGSKYAAKLCNGITDWGVVYFDINGDDYTWGRILHKWPEIADTTHTV